MAHYETAVSLKPLSTVHAGVRLFFGDRPTQLRASEPSYSVYVRSTLVLLDVGGAQVLATDKSARAETDIKYAIIGTALGVAISAVFLALKYCMIKKHLFDNDSSDLRSTHLGYNDTIELKKRIPR
ncbi:putative uncharacterized protein C10orf128 homolog [Pteropus alecto]|uniref:putative uncharacterized protein C10orf128 homolog n=1 Tax=Pteropus alecto TaxID=9402 RepID=UPI000D53A60F|nr:putative uncharacterized protein C10orf128 homolog [Pteropus alecto]